MKKTTSGLFETYLMKMGIGLKARLMIIIFISKVIPVIILAAISWQQINNLGASLRDIAVSDSTKVMNETAIDNIERITTDVAMKMSDFLYQRDNDIMLLANLEPTQKNYKEFIENKKGRLIEHGEWQLDDTEQFWIPVNDLNTEQDLQTVSTKVDTGTSDDIHIREPEKITYYELPLYDEITFIDLTGNELVKVTNSSKQNYPLSTEKKDISKKENTYIKAETYFEHLEELKPGEIYVSDVIGAYVGTNYIGLYTPSAIKDAEEEYGYEIEYTPEMQAYAGDQNPAGQQFEGIVRWATPVTDESGEKIGYVTFALNHTHIMEFTNHITPTKERYVQLPAAREGNYAFVWDYKCRIISHPKHHTIVGYDANTGEPQVPWLEDRIYNEWQESKIEKWTDFVENITEFEDQSRDKVLSPELEQAGFVAYDGRYLNNAPQCGRWMEITHDGSSGSLYLKWVGMNKVTTVAPIPYYTGQYAPSAENNFTKRGFGFVVIGAEMDAFINPVKETEEKLILAGSENLKETFAKLMFATGIIIILVIFAAVHLASSLTKPITFLVEGISQFRAGKRHFRFPVHAKDEFGVLAEAFNDMADNVVNSRSNSLVITDIEQKVVFVNSHGLKLIGTEDLSGILGKKYADVSVYPKDSVFCPIAALERGEEAEIYYMKEQDLYLRGKANYFHDKDGLKSGFMIETTDVTAMMLDKQKIENQNAILEELFSVSPDLIWFMDCEGTYQAVNARFADIAGTSPAEFVGKKAEDVLPADAAEILSKNDEIARDGKNAIYTEEKIRFTNQRVEILDSIRTPILDGNGNVTGMIGFARDVTSRVDMEQELRETQQELKQAVIEAKQASQHKGEFLARMSHEIRTPMNAIMGLTEIILRYMRSAAYHMKEEDIMYQSMQQIDVSSKHLLGLINDILDLTKIEAGKIELSNETVDLPRLAYNVTDIIQPRCDEKQISLITEFDEFAVPCFWTDALRLRQVLINLLGNAVKFTSKHGCVRFSIKKKEQKDNWVLVHFSVADSGIGISDEAKGTIFKAFEQGGNAITSQFGGTGLGLAISNRIVNLFGGNLQVESQMGKGSEFSFSVWMQESTEILTVREDTWNPKGKLSGKRTLLVDDVEINRVVIRAMLEDSGLEIDEAADGLEALELFENSPEGTYDLIFMDIHMPHMNGYDTAEAIRALKRQDAKDVYIIAVTADAFKEDIDLALEHGMSTHLAKPVDMDHLFEVLFDFIHRKSKGL